MIRNQDVRRGWAARTVLGGAALLLTLAAAGCSGGGGHRQAAGCTGERLGPWSQDAATTGEFGDYGDDTARSAGWTGGDGTHSVRLPDGRTLWFEDDTLLGSVHQPPNSQGQPYPWREAAVPTVHNSVLVMDRSGWLERTLTGAGTAAPPGAFFPDLDHGAAVDQQIWRWPMQGTVEPAAPGSSRQVVRVLLWDRAAGPPPWVYGVPLATEVATLSLPDLRLESVTPVSNQWAVPAPGHRVLFGTAVVQQGGWTYVFGNDDGPGRGAGASQAYLARVPVGRLADAAAWRYWDGRGWGAQSASARPVLAAGGARGVGTAYSVVRRDGAWLLLTMDTGGPGASGLSTLTSYWSCSPQGPWHGPNGAVRLPVPPDASDAPSAGGPVVYNPQAHPEFGDRGGLLVSYDVNWLAPSAATVQANVARNVSLYRPRFLRVRLDPARAGSG